MTDRLRGYATAPAAIEAAVLVAILALAAWIFLIPLHNATNYDEGNYLAALSDLRHGFALGSDVYADQPPGWYSLLRLVAWVFGNSLTGVRTGLFVLALVGVVAAWACARALGALPAAGAAVLLVIAPPYAAQATQIEADTPAAVLALAALAAAMWGYRRKSSPSLAAAAGALLAAAISIKLSAATAVLPFAFIAAVRWRLVIWSLLGALAVILVEVVSFRNDLGPIARGAIGQHTSALGSSHWSRATNVHRLLHFLNSHTPFSWLVLAAALASLWLAHERDAEVGVLGRLWMFVPAGVAFILAMKPLLDHHLVILAVSLALPAGAGLGLAIARLPPGYRAGAALAMTVAAAAAGFYQQHRQLVRSVQPEPAWVRRAADKLRAMTRPDEIVATDIPVIAYYAHRRLVPDFVDTSFTRLAVGELTPKRVFAEMNRYDVRIAAIGRTFWADAAIHRAFDAGFLHHRPAPNIVFYTGRKLP